MQQCNSATLHLLYVIVVLIAGGGLKSGKLGGGANERQKWVRKSETLYITPLVTSWGVHLQDVVGPILKTSGATRWVPLVFNT